MADQIPSHDDCGMLMVTEEMVGVHPIHTEYPLLPGDVLVRRPDGTFGKLTGLGIEGFTLTAEQAITLKPTEGQIVIDGGLSRPPIFVRGGKRLNFEAEAGGTFIGYGKDEGCSPSCSWEELCAMAKLIVDHPAFRLPEPTDYYPPQIEDE